MRFAVLAFALLLSLSLTGCDEEDCWLCWGEPNQGRLSLGVTAAPTDKADNVYLSITRIDLQDARGDWQRFDLNPPQLVNLLPEQELGQNRYDRHSALLLDGVQLGSGKYQQIQLFVDALPDTADQSYVMAPESGGRFDIEIQKVITLDLISLDQSFDMPRNGPLRQTIVFDLHRGLTDLRTDSNAREYFQLKPSGNMRLVEDDKSGSISGAISSDLIASSNCFPPTHNGYVYIFEDEDMKQGEVPLSSLSVTNITGWEDGFQAHFLPEGRYTLALFCEAEDDEPYSRNSRQLSRTIRGVRVIAKETTDVGAL